ncbi:MAG: rhomboid family intramembrane serine protease [Polyangiales bacterium]
MSGSGSDANGANGKNGHGALRDAAPHRDTPPGLELIGPVRDARKLAELQLVIKALGVQHGISSRDDGFYFLVPVKKAARVRDALIDYERENRDWPPRRAPREKLAYAGASSSRLSVVWAAVLSIVFLFSGTVAVRGPWFRAGVASSDRILHGEVWRAVTALTLHADAAHLFGNVAAGGVFLWAASRRLGAGRAAMFTLLAGTIGNLANAVAHGIQHVPHSSIGASTAVFATVGLLVGSQARVNRGAGTRSMTDRMGPWVGGAAILGMLGASAQSDLWAHFYGLVAGVLLGLAAARTPAAAESAKGARRWVQPAYALATIGTLVASWGLAFAYPHA